MKTPAQRRCDLTINARVCAAKDVPPFDPRRNMLIGESRTLIPSDRRALPDYFESLITAWWKSEQSPVYCSSRLQPALIAESGIGADRPTLPTVKTPP